MGNSFLKVSIPLKRVKNSERWFWSRTPSRRGRLNPLKAGQEFGAEAVQKFLDKLDESQSP